MGCCHSADNVLIEQLTKSPFFSLDVSSDSTYLAALAKRFTKITYNSTEQLWTKGDLITSFNIIIEGEVVLKFKEDDQSLEVEKGEGQCFGFHALRDMTSFKSTENDSIGVNYDCIAVTDLTVYQITADRLLRFDVLLLYEYDGRSLCFPQSPSLFLYFLSISMHSVVLYTVFDEYAAIMLTI